MSFFYLLLGLLPSFLQRPIRNALGARIERGAHIAPLTLVTVKDLRMAPGARIGPLVRIKAQTMVMGRNARIRPVTMIKVRNVELGRDALVDPMVLINCDYGPRSRFELGRASRVMSFSVIEPSEGVFIGEQTGVGGQCLIFCHGSWPNYLEGAPYARGPVHLGDQVWIPWRVMILPNSEIGSCAIIGAHSLVRGKVPPRALSSGVPARLVKEDVWTPIDDQAEKERRMAEIVESFHREQEERSRGRLEVFPLASARFDAAAPELVVYSYAPIGRAEAAAAHGRHGVTVIDLARLFVLPGGPLGHEFVHHLERFGIRLSAADESEL